MTKCLSLIAVVMLAVALPNISESANTSGPCFGADAMCKPYAIPGCKCGEKMGAKGCEKDPNNKFGCVCTDAQTGVSGTCEATCKCKGGGGGGDAKGMADMMKGIMDMLKQAMKGGDDKGGGGGGGQKQGEQPGQQGCTSYYQVTVPSTDPCAYYVPPTSNSLLDIYGSTSSATSQLLDILNAGTGISLGTESQTSVSEQLLNIGSGKQESGTQTSGSGTTVQTGTLASNQVKLQSGTQGNIVVGPTGATVVASARDEGSNTEVAGFYGGEISGATLPQGIAANLCRNRPWASSVVAFVIPPAFFDGLCAWRGYPVGIPTPSPSPAPVAKTSTATKTNIATTTPVASGPVVEPEVDIWAVPSRVPLGARTSVFWNTKGVASCTVSSPDGSFNETSVSGGASTVPLSGATTFTISCLTQDGKPVTDYVIVNLTI